MKNSCSNTEHNLIKKVFQRKRRSRRPTHRCTQQRQSNCCYVLAVISVSFLWSSSSPSSPSSSSSSSSSSTLLIYATSSSSSSSSISKNSPHSSYHCYHDMYDATNPLWREEHHYTGERRGPVTTPAPKNCCVYEQTNRHCYLDKKSTTQSIMSINDPRFHHQNNNKDTILDRDESMQLSSHIELRRRGGGGGGGDGGGSSIDDDDVHDDAIHPSDSYSLGQDTRLLRPVSSVTIRRPMPHTKTRTNNNPTGRFPLTFQQRIGRLDVDFFHSPRVPSPSSKQYQTTRTTPPPLPSLPTTDGQQNNYTTTMVTTDSSTNMTAAPVIETTTSEQSHQELVLSSPTPTKIQSTDSNTPIIPTSTSSNVKVALALDPFSLATLVRNGLVASTNLVSAVFGTIQLMGPMILAKRILTTLGYIFYDHYNGRYLRTTYTRRMRHMQEFEVIASARALGRFLLQCWVMSMVGSLVSWTMNHPWTPSCLLQPTRVCHGWYGIVWMTLVYWSGWGIGVAIRKEGYTFHRGSGELNNRQGKSPSSTSGTIKFYVNPLSIRPTYVSTVTRRLRRRQHPTNSSSKLDHILYFPRQLLQWMKEPEESINNLFRFAHQKSNHPIRPVSPTKRSLDTLLFPSTWGPLQLWSCLTVIYAIFVTLSKASSVGNNNESLHRVMKTFILHESFHSEWYRVFVRERRIALGAVISMIGLWAFLRMVVVMTLIDKWAGLALIPMLIAEVVTWYMNTILYFDHYLPSIRPPHRKT
jgi:tryptophan-rich sensory protein